MFSVLIVELAHSLQYALAGFLAYVAMVAQSLGDGHLRDARALGHLADLGYTILLRRYKTRHGEIDLVCLLGEQLVFVEVKARTHRLSRPEAAMGPRKLAALARAAHCYLAELGEPDRGFRLYLIAIHGNELRHHEDLFGL